MDNYIPRHLRISEDGVIHENEILNYSKCIVVLGEPGAGKTELLNNIAKTFNTSSIPATIFKVKKNFITSALLVIDGFDEVTKLDNSAIDSIIQKIAEIEPRYLILSSRASEWDEKRFSPLITEITNLEPKIVYLKPLTKEEQCSYIKCNYPTIDMLSFFMKMERLELSNLLSNPLFLFLFSKTYEKKHEICNSKLSLIEESINLLSMEHNAHYERSRTISTQEIICTAGEIFAKLLLSSYSGISIVESSSDDNFAYLYDIILNNDQILLKNIIDTQLFKPYFSSNLYIPIHRIIAELSAAKFLSNRINNLADQLTLKRCLSIIAPNNVVRNELRGLIGWLAIFVKEEYQQILIEIDPYAIIANVEPSKLNSASKIKLLHELTKLEKVNPYFRRSDRLRGHFGHNYIDEKMIDECKKILILSPNDSDLYQLLLESLEEANSCIVLKLSSELNTILSDTKQDKYNRLSALKALSKSVTFAPSNILVSLINECSNNSLELSYYLLDINGKDTISREIILSLFVAFTTLCEKKSYDDLNFNHNWFIKRVIDKFQLDDIEYFLDNLASKIHCTCSASNNYQCFCRHGISIIIGKILNRYFEIQEEQLLSAEKIFGWIKNLNYHHSRPSNPYSSLEVLKNNNQLRQGIQLLYIQKIKSHNHFRYMYIYISDIHAGLAFSHEDNKFIIEYAYQHDDATLWGQLYRWPSRQFNQQEQDIRQLMKEHAQNKLEFMKIWAKFNYYSKQSNKSDSEYKYRRSSRRWARKNKLRKGKEQQYIAQNYTEIIQGKHWPLLQQFAWDYLSNTNDIEYIPEFAQNALKNSLNLITPKLPNLSQVKLNNYKNLIMLCHALALIYFREGYNLAILPKSLLKLVKLDTKCSYGNNTYDSDEENQFKLEIDRCLFDNIYSFEDYIREYIEPQLKSPIKDVDFNILYDAEGKLPSIMETLSIEWFSSLYIKNLTSNSLNNLFQICISYEKNTPKIKDIIKQQCINYQNIWEFGPPNLDTLAKRKFWFIREFLLIDELDFVWNELKVEPYTVLELRTMKEFYFRDNSSWIIYDACKVYKILDAFILKWPEVELPNHWGTDSPPKGISLSIPKRYCLGDTKRST